MSSTNRKNIAFTVAYLIGVDSNFLTRDYPECNDLYTELYNNKQATTIRYLCRLRTALLRNFKRTDEEMRYNLKNLNSLDWYEEEEIKTLEKWGLQIIQANSRSEVYLTLFCKLIDENIDSCKKLMPDWVDWSYIRELFVVPKYTSKNVMKSEFEKFRGNMVLYPYSMYVYWQPFDCKGMLLDDKLFLKSLYSLHNDDFSDKSKYIEVSSVTTKDINNYIQNGNRVVIAVDCENTDVYKLYSFVKSLDKNIASKIEKIILYDDENTVETWKMLSEHIGIPTEYTVVERILEAKSLVDIKMTTGICQSHFKDGIDSFILVSSDSDYWGMISSLPDANFMVVYESSKVSPTTIDTLSKHSILSCSLDDFYSGDVSTLKEDILVKSANKLLGNIHLNCKELVNEVYTFSHINATTEEKNAFYDKFTKKLKMSIDSEGNFSVSI